MASRMLLINSVLGEGSTGKIVGSFAKHFDALGWEVKVGYGRGKPSPQYAKYAVKIGNGLEVDFHALRSRCKDEMGLGSKKGTERFLRFMDSFQPDVLWLHNLHGYYLNLPSLFSWIRSHPQVRVFLTLHDCWLFTGHCSHFLAAKCDQWKQDCQQCPGSYPHNKDYPKTWIQPRCKANFAWKKALFQDLPNLTILTPSDWIGNEARQSFLGQYPILTMRNPIDLSAFQKTDSDFRSTHGLKDKTILLSMAGVWSSRKGLSDLLNVFRLLDSRFVLILVGTKRNNLVQIRHELSDLNFSEKKTGECVEFLFPSSIEKQNSKPLPSYVSASLPEDPRIMASRLLGAEIPSNPQGGAKLICIPPTHDSKQLAEYDSIADVFLNCTHEDNYPTVNLEARACGCPVLTYEVGGCKETLSATLEFGHEYWSFVEGVLAKKD